MMNAEEFERLKRTIAMRKKHPSRDVVTAADLTAVGGTHFANVSLTEYLSEQEPVKVKSFYQLEADYRGRADFERFVGRKVEAVYDRTRVAGPEDNPTVYGNLVALRCGRNIVHCLF